MRLAQEDDELVIYISNAGTFRPALPAADARGRGIALMTLLMDEVELRRGEDNMLVRLAKRLHGDMNGDGDAQAVRSAETGAAEEPLPADGT